MACGSHSKCDILPADSTILWHTFETGNPFRKSQHKNGVDSVERDHEKLSSVLSNLSLKEENNGMMGYPAVTEPERTSQTFEDYINGLPQKRKVSKLKNIRRENQESSNSSYESSNMENTMSRLNETRDSVRPKNSMRRAISETKSPAEHVRMTRQLLEMNKQSVLRESDLYENEKFHLNIIEENLTKIDSAAMTTNSCKSKKHGKLKRSKTANDFEGICKPKASLAFSKSIDETSGVMNFYAEDDRFEKPPDKPVSKRKQIKRTLSMRFSRLKELSSMSSSRSHRKLRNEYFLHEDCNVGHETSRRKMYTLDTEDLTMIGERKKNKESGLRRRSLSMPANIDLETQDEDLEDLYLPRRMAICPNLSVPAMKQLKTYLILTRLKQYCFV